MLLQKIFITFNKLKNKENKIKKSLKIVVNQFQKTWGLIAVQGYINKFFFFF